jgi:iron(II)-dependent oxidoreductase
MAGTISAGALGDEARKALASEEYQRGQEARDKVARDELAREAEARRTYDDETTRKQRQEEERLRKEKEEQEARDRQQREQLDRVSKQAKELEERLARLATSMPPGAVDPEATQVQQSLRPRPVGNQSVPPYAGNLEHSQMPFGVTQKPRSIVAVTGVGLLVILLLGGGTIGYFVLQPTQQAPSAVSSSSPGATPTVSVQVAGSADMVQIPGGTFQMGRNDGPPQEQPEHPVTVQAFLMDRTEVTNLEYGAFVADTNYQAPSHFVRGQPLPGQEQWPVVNVSPIDAQAFAAWRSKRDNVEYRLPTEEEWEYAARSGGEYKLFPWGNRFEEKRAVVKEASPRAVGSYPQGANRWGVLDLIGNVWEWTSSKASLYTRGSSAIPGGSKEWVVARGGSYSSDPDNPEIPVSSTYRDWYDPTSRHPNFGFRLVRSAQ